MRPNGGGDKAIRIIFFQHCFNTVMLLESVDGYPPKRSVGSALMLWHHGNKCRSQ